MYYIIIVQYVNIYLFAKEAVYKKLYYHRNIAHYLIVLCYNCCIYIYIYIYTYSWL